MFSEQGSEVEVVMKQLPEELGEEYVKTDIDSQTMNVVGPISAACGEGIRKGLEKDSNASKKLRWTYFLMRIRHKNLQYTS